MIYLACAMLLTANPPATDSLARYEFEQIRMGTAFKISLYANDESAAKQAATAAFARIKQLDRIMSDYDPDSELRQLCAQAGSGQAIPISQDLRIVLAHSLDLSRRTHGAFDVTVGPLVKLWRRARRKKQLPPQKALTAALAATGYSLVHLDPTASTVKLDIPGMQLDLGGIAKGYAADEALSVLRQHGISRALIDAGGDIVLGDPPPGKPGWRIGIAPLAPKDAPPSRFVTLKNASIATSGDAWRYVELDGVRYSHIINPATGYGLTQRSSVTVIAPNGITADSLASAVSVLGPKKGVAFIENTCTAETLVITLKDNKPIISESSGFPKQP